MKQLICLALLAACSTTPVDASGQYTIAVTNRDNGCTFSNYTVGAMSSGINVTIQQQASQANADVMGATAVLLDFALGSHTFSGAVDGSSLDLTIVGTRPTTTGNCTYTYNATIAASLNGDVLTGRIEYRAASNHNSDCGAIDGCLTYQDFNGTRPPR